DNLKRAEPDGDESEAGVIDFDAVASGFFVFVFRLLRIPDQNTRHNERDDPDRDVDKKDPAPGKMISDPTSESWAEGGRHHNGHTIYGERHAAFFRRECVSKDGLFRRCKASSADSLKNPENEQYTQIW